MNNDLVFKYLKWEYPEGTLDEKMFGRYALFNSKFYFATPSQLNDPFDSRIIVDEFLRSLPEGIEIDNDLDKKLGLTCFSKENSITLMWSHYADSHKGYCLGFDMDMLTCHFKAFFNGDISALGHVNYDSDYFVYCEENVCYYSSREEYVLRGCIESISRKSLDWKYEKEVRIIQELDRDENSSFPKNSLKEVVFGLDMRQESRDDIRAFCKANYPSVTFYECIIDPDKIGVKVVPIKE